MPHLHTIQSPNAHTQRQSAPGRPAKSSQSGSITKREITAADAPKIAMAGAALLLILIGAQFAVGRVHAKHEQEATFRHMNMEMGRGPDADASQMPESEPGAGDPNFVW